MKRWLTLLGLLASQAVPAATVQLSTPDGLSIHAQTAGTGDHAVLLVHGWGQSSHDWATLNEHLVSHDFFVLTLDLRGHGQSETPAALNEEDCTPMKADLEAALAWLKQRNPSSLMLVGAELGANLALQVASSHEEVTNVALLSPGLNHCGVKVGAAIAAYTQRPILFAASETDATSKKAATLLQAKATGPSHLELIEGGARGIRLLNASPQLESVLVGWLNGTMWHEGTTLHQPLLTPSSNATIETTGTRLEDRN